ncbi:MAG: peptidoglycan bridge formation glycyltransferase FemA/FemB family protein, partial [Spirochaetota bacterium]
MSLITQNQNKSQVTEFRVCTEAQYRASLEDKDCRFSFLQSPFWGRFKNNWGWSPHYFCGKVEMVGEDGQFWGRDFSLLVLSRSLLPSPLPALFSLAYIPFGPFFFTDSADSSALASNFSESSAAELAGDFFADAQEYFIACRLVAKKLLGYIPLSCFFVRLDSNHLVRWQRLPLGDNQGNQGGQGGQEVQNADSLRKFARKIPQNAGFYRAAQRVQVPDTVLLDLRPGEEELLAQMHKKHRYNIRLAQKKGVEVRSVVGSEGLEEWYALYQITARRDKIGIHNFAYYRTLFEQLEGEPDASLFLYMAYDSADGSDSPALAGIIVLHYRGTATYMYGASSNRKRELMPNYLLQWHAISQARAAGLCCYDFFGVPPHSEPGHPLHGLYRFKVGFGAYLVQRYG